MSALLLLLLAAPPAPPAPARPPEGPDAAVVARARAALGPFKKELKETLTKALEQSPEAAIEVCAKKAPDIARAHSRDGVVVGRSALKLRNPANAPPAWLGPVMEELARLPSATEGSKLVTLPDGRRGYAEPIWTGDQCVLCHGAAVPPALDAKLKAAYPRDAARGFKPGDFRGVFWAELPPPAAPAPGR